MLKQQSKKIALLTGLLGCVLPLGMVSAEPVTPASKAQPLSVFKVRCVKTPQRIAFSPNGYAGSVNYPLPLNCPEANFLISAKAGQRMVLILTSPGAARAEIKSPDNTSDGSPVGNGGVIFNKMLTSTGDYQIRISKSTMAEPWAGQIILTAVIQPNI
jgi:hypothetical protein